MYLEEFEKLVSIMHRLRKECPWDKEQTPQTLRQYILEEAYETVETIDEENWPELKKELGDLLLQVVFQAEIAQEEKRFELHEVIAHINNKLIERHPHVFGDVEVNDSNDVRDNWEQIKFKSEKRKSLLQGIPRNLSALLRAQRLQDKASQSGFDWDNPADVLDKVKEELSELESAKNQVELEEEMGDLLFSIVNYCRFKNINAEDAIRKTNKKFTDRFQYIERKLAESGETMKDRPLEELDQLWDEAKAIERGNKSE
ncbi:MAG: nucleoside triphosphate pyrophosphohydrolase [Calditrichota bacterium]